MYYNISVFVSTKSTSIYLYTTYFVLMREPEYFQEYMRVKELDSDKQLTWSGKRGSLTKKYGWTIPNKKVIEFLTKESMEFPLFEIGAGNGYLSYEIQNNGGNTVPIDISPSKNAWADVYNMSYENLEPDNVSHIILPWPPANSPMGEECIKYLNPSTVYFIGKDKSRVTGTKELHEVLQSEYECTHNFVLPSWTDNKTVFKKYTT